jgi:magnesium-transporting ATPase (P-type)
MHTKYSDFQYYTLVLDGTTVSYILSSDSETKEKFFKLGYLAESCICCRLSPSQKADLVSLAHQFGNAITLSIGDGANDVNMIQTARIGVGISGKEGPQAAQASDFEIAQFRFLQQLLFIHGRYGYRRICTFICYYFYKNITLVFSEIWFAIVCGFSGQIFFLDWLPMLYNILWTSWPCMLGFAFYKDIKEEVCIEYPNIFGAGSCNAYFSFGIFWKWLIFAVIHGTMCFWYSILCFQEAFEGSAKDAGLWFISTVSFSTVIMLVNLKLMLELTHFSWKFV